MTQSDGSAAADRAGRPPVWIVVFAIALVLAAALVYAASPLLALYQLRGAIEAKDSERLRQVIDFPAVRASVKDGVASLTAAALEPKDAKGTPLSSVGTFLAGALAGPLVDVLVTPRGIVAMLKTGVPKAPAADGGTAANSNSNASANAPNTSMGYTSLDRFVLHVWPSDSPRPEDGIGFTFCRGGFSWKMCRIDLPHARRTAATTHP
jgi:hypothetical protein